MKLAILLLVLAMFNLVPGFVGLLNNSEGFLINLLGGAVFAVLGFMRLSKVKSDNTKTVADDVIPDKTYSCDIAGTVSEESQGILRNVYLNSKHDKNNVAVLEDDIYISEIEESSKAYIVCYQGEMLGNIPESSVDDFLIIYDRILYNKILIDWYTKDDKRIYVARLMSFYK